MPHSTLKGQALPKVEDIAAAWQEHTQTLHDFRAEMAAAESRIHVHLDQVANRIDDAQIAEIKEAIRQMRIEFDARLQVLEGEAQARAVGGES